MIDEIDDARNTNSAPNFFAQLLQPRLQWKGKAVWADCGLAEKSDQRKLLYCLNRSCPNHLTCNEKRELLP
ncbi:hypothetical protein CHX27_14775 [Flavobacterium aurantiibacter]|uniref:Uncharacterized protein n=1 Tax=Flavobacterium aurantiibacter TaxID=2023067 RepID=A0A255ZAM3_9FLAO|nr:hypothetical protein CHX27_14775 [Flavobacterium aurantiibacter]